MKTLTDEKNFPLRRDTCHPTTHRSQSHRTTLVSNISPLFLSPFAPFAAQASASLLRSQFSRSLNLFALKMPLRVSNCSTSPTVAWPCHRSTPHRLADTSDFYLHLFVRPQNITNLWPWFSESYTDDLLHPVFRELITHCQREPQALLPTCTGNSSFLVHYRFPPQTTSLLA